jgi:hypothetical protein
MSSMKYFKFILFSNSGNILCYPKKSVQVYSYSNTVYNEDQRDLKNFRLWHVVSVSHECLYF